MLGRDATQAFREGAWRSPEEAEAFAAAAPAEAGDIPVLLAVLTDQALVGDANRHRLRCHVFARLAQAVPDPKLFPHYVRALKAGDRHLRTTLSALLPAVTDLSRHAHLCELLRSTDADLRAAAVVVLRQVGGRTVLETLAAMVAEPEFAGRREAIELLAAVAGAWAIPAFQTVLAVGRPVEKRLCLRYLGSPEFVGHSTASALAAIRPALADASDAVAIDAIAAFCRLCTREQYFEAVAPLLDGDRLPLVKTAIAGITRFVSPRVMVVLERLLRRPSNEVRLATIAALEAIGTEEVGPLLVEALGHRNLRVRSRARDAVARLSESGKVHVGRSIIWLLRSGDLELRRTAADLARSVADPGGELWPKLLRFLRDEDWWVRERVTDALVEMGGVQLSPVLVEYLSDPSDLIRRFAVEVFARLKDPRSLGLMITTASKDTDWWVRERAVEAMASIGNRQAVPYIVNLMLANPELRVVCLRALLDLKAASAAPQAVSLLGDSDPDVRLTAVRCLEAVGDPAFLPDVKPLAADSVPSVRSAALEVLARWSVPLAEAAGTPSRLDALLAACVERRAEDLILGVGRPPSVKRMGRIEPLEKEPLLAEGLEALILPRLTLAQMDELKARRDVDFSCDLAGRGVRFRVNVFHEMGGLSAVFRLIHRELPDLAALGLPPVVQGFADFRDGLVLVGGPTGSGKSTTLAALVDHVNRTSSRHVISLEDPIEVVHRRKKGVVNQREIGTHTVGTATALRSTLREDPDVILVGEMRDLPTISFAVTAAETGHLVFGTVHTVSADTTVDRIVDAFPIQARDHVRSMLADSLRAVLCQHLVPRKDGKGRVLAAEVLLNNEAVASLIRKGKAFQVPSVIATSREQGMQSMDGELRRLVQEGLISMEDAYVRAVGKKDFEEGGEGAPAAGASRLRTA